MELNGSSPTEGHVRLGRERMGSNLLGTTMSGTSACTAILLAPNPRGTDGGLVKFAELDLTRNTRRIYVLEIAITIVCAARTLRV